MMQGLALAGNRTFQYMEKTVVKPHEATEPTELDLNRGDKVIVLDFEEGWHGGHKSGEDKLGWFPSNCLDFLGSLDTMPGGETDLDISTFSDDQSFSEQPVSCAAAVAAARADEVAKCTAELTCIQRDSKIITEHMTGLLEEKMRRLEIEKREACDALNECKNLRLELQEAELGRKKAEREQANLGRKLEQLRIKCDENDALWTCTTHETAARNSAESLSVFPSHSDDYAPMHVNGSTISATGAKLQLDESGGVAQEISRDALHGSRWVWPKPSALQGPTTPPPSLARRPRSPSEFFVDHVARDKGDDEQELVDIQFGMSPLHSRCPSGTLPYSQHITTPPATRTISHASPQSRGSSVSVSELIRRLEASSGGR